MTPMIPPILMTPVASSAHAQAPIARVKVV
jgi:hypothetical protein